MKALVLDAPHALRFDTLPDPVVPGGSVLVRVHATGISEDDVKKYQCSRADILDPLVLGDEIAGSLVGGARDGTRVVINPMLTCGECSACMSGRTNLCPELTWVSTPANSGGLAEFVMVPCSNIIQLPDSVPFTTACLIDPLARGWHLARMSRRAFPRGREALVIGQGAIGVGAKLALQAQGIENVLMVDETFQPESEFDIIIDAVSTPVSRTLASSCVAAGGVIGLAAMAAESDGLDLRRLSKQEVTLMCSTAYTTLDFQDTAAAAFDGRLGPLDWAVILPMANAPKVFADIAAGRINAPRVVLAPDVT